MSQKRRYPRYLTLKMGHIASKGGLSLDCAVLNVSLGGACLLVSDATVIPDVFDLTMDHDHRVCNVAWRDRHRLGISFADVAQGEDEMPAGIGRRGAEHGDDVLRVAELFLRGSGSYTDQQIELFDNVMQHLIEITENRSLAKLSSQMAPVKRAPVRVIQRLANDEDITVSGPVLERSPVLAEDFLVRIARSKSQAHLLALAGRILVQESVTDILVDRGNQSVARKVSANDGARFSKDGFHRLAMRAREDDELVLHLAQREETPADILESVMRQAPEPVRRHLLSNADPAMRKRIAQTLASPAPRPVRPAPRRALSRSAEVLPLDRNGGELKRSLTEAARAGRLADTIQAMARVCQVPVEFVRNLVGQGSEDGVLILCKAAGLGWPDTKMVLSVTMERGSRVDFKDAFDRYIGFSHDLAQRGVRYLKARRTASSDELRRML